MSTNGFGPSGLNTNRFSDYGFNTSGFSEDGFRPDGFSKDGFNENGFCGNRFGMMVGILGGGQLGRMLALAGYPLGLRFRVLETYADAPAADLAEFVVGESYDDREALARFAGGLTLATYEFENVPVAAARFLASRVPVYPPPQALEVSQDRQTEKTFFRTLDIPTPDFRAVDSQETLETALRALGTPAVLKTRRLGYDGKGQRILRRAADAQESWIALQGQPLILEAFVPFDREVSLLSVRGRDGGTAFYPLIENYHHEGILRRSIAPAPATPPTLEAQAESYGRRVLEALDYVGALAIEFFQVGDRLLANEMAPRVHNSGHWTIEGAETSQFENHLRAVLGLPLGATTPRGYSVMLNLIGEIPDHAAMLALPNAHLHLYAKEPRPGRKLGHITVRGDDEHATRSAAAALQDGLGLR